MPASPDQQHPAATAAAPTGTPDPLLTALAVEQACRDATHVADVAPLALAAPRSLAAHVALGRLLTAVPVTLAPGTPLAVLCAGGDVDPRWRDACPIRPGSLADTLALYEQLVGPAALPGAPHGLTGLGAASPASPVAQARDALDALDILAERAGIQPA